MNQLERIIRTFFRPVKAPTVPLPLLMPTEYPDLSAYEAIEKIANDFRTHCPGPFKGHACDNVQCNYRINDLPPPENCSYWQALRANLGAFDANEALQVMAKLQMRFLASATRIEDFMTKYLTKRGVLELLLAQQAAWFLLQILLKQL